MSHKILIELDEKQEAVLREIAEYDEVSLSYAASQLFGDYLLKLEPFMSDMKDEAEKKPTIYISGRDFAYTTGGTARLNLSIAVNRSVKKNGAYIGGAIINLQLG